MHRKIGTIFDAQGNPMSGVSITVKLAGTATNGTLFSDNNRTSLGNPFTNDSNGSFEFYAPNGTPIPQAPRLPRGDCRTLTSANSRRRVRPTPLSLSPAETTGENVDLGWSVEGLLDSRRRE